MMSENDGKRVSSTGALSRVYRQNANGDYLNANGEVVSKANAEVIAYAHTAGTTREHIVVEGAYRYNRWELMVEAGENCNSLADTGYWTIGADGAPVWGS